MDSMANPQDQTTGKPQHYRASQEAAGAGPLWELGGISDHPVAFAYWRVGAVDRVNHPNDDHPTILFHAAGAQVRSEACARFRAAGLGWPGDALLVPVGADVNCRWSEPVEFLHVYFRPGFIEQLSLAEHGKSISELQDRSHVHDAELACKLNRLLRFGARTAPDKLLLDELALDLGATTLRVFSPHGGSTVDRRVSISPRRLRLVLDRIEGELGGSLTIADLASLAGLSPSHFARSFSKEVGCSPYAFLLRRRVDRAKRLMTDPNAPLSVIARACGFSSPGHLSNVFRQLTGDSPRAWRANI
jgi:AraC family transcriptional regulator